MGLNLQLMQDEATHPGIRSSRLVVMPPPGFRAATSSPKPLQEGLGSVLSSSSVMETEKPSLKNSSIEKPPVCLHTMWGGERRDDVPNPYTLRQHFARFVRMTFSFSKSVLMHEACLLLFLHRSNREQAILLK